VKIGHESLGGKSDREAILEILDRNGIGYTRGEDAEDVADGSIVFTVPVDFKDRVAKKVDGYSEFFSVLCFDETETLTGVEVWE